MSRKLLVMLAVALLGVATVSCGRSSNIAQPGRTLPPGTKPPVAGSVQGKPCVAPAADNPTAEGQPVVDIPVGPPPTTLVSKDLKVGEGAEVKVTDKVKVHYVGLACSTGKQFDGNFGKDPITFGLDGVIAGWTQGIPGMKVGGQRQLVIPPDLAYKDQQKGADIAPFETLVFVIQLEGIEAADATSTTLATTPTVPGSTVATTPGSTPGTTP